jgi:D-lactate dehydrogenase
MKRLDAHFPIDNGDRVVCLAGCGISTLASSVRSWFPDRESHSVLGSTFLNPTTAAGVAFGSGGVYMRKGPARTDRAMYCRVSRSKWGENAVTVVNTLGIRGLEDSDFQEHSGENAVKALDAYANDVRRGFRRAMAESSSSVHGRAKSSDTDYADALCKCTRQVSRCNADTAGEDCNRSEGKVVILATVHDTFPMPKTKRVFWVSFPDMETTLAFRREVCLNNPTDMPISCEYLDRDSVDIIDRSGRISAHLIRYLGMGDIMGALWDIKVRISSLPFSWAPIISDKILYILNDWVPEAIPKKFMNVGKEWDHHCLVAVGEFGGGTLDRFVDKMNKFVEEQNEKIQEGGRIVSVTEAETVSDMDALNAFRYVAALAFKTYCIGEDLQGISIDYALPMNGGLVPPLPASAATPLKRMRYSHLGCNVVHEDVAYALGVDTHKEKMLLKHIVEEQGGKLPAEQ